MILLKAKYNSTFNELLIKLFLFLLPFMLPYALRNSIISYASHVSVYIILIVLFLKSCKNNYLQTNKCVMFLLIVELIWVSITLFNAVRLYLIFGEIGGEDTFKAIQGPMYFHLFMFASFYSLTFLFKNTDNVGEIIDSTMNFLVNIEIVIGLFQLLIIFNFPLVSQFYDFFNIGEILCTSSFLKTMHRISLSGSEPASLGVLICILFLPYLISKRKYLKKRRDFYISNVRIVFFLIFLFFSYSTTAYVIFIIQILCFGIRKISYIKKYAKKLFFFGMIFLLCVSSLMIPNVRRSVINSEIYQSIQYVAINKLTDTSNQSTTHRWTSIINDLKVFQEFPLLGVGDGNQGFRYATNIPSYMAKNPKTQEMIEGDYGVVNGGPFLFAILSGFGIVGLIPFILWLIEYFKYIRKDVYFKKQYLYEWFKISFPSIIITLMTGGMRLEVIFILSFPFISKIRETKNKSLLN